MTQTVLHGDCVDVMRGMDAESIDAIVCDPPYDLTAGKKGGSGPASYNEASPAGRARATTGFMGKSWDGTGVAFDPTTWAEALRVLKPGAHLVAFGAPRTFHRLAVAIEDAGFEIRDCLSWLFGSGFPKSLNLGDGRGTALKPAWEPCTLARKPILGTVAANVARYGTGALYIDACRIEGADGDGHWSGDDGSDATSRPGYDGGFTKGGAKSSGRWPANVALDEEAAAMLDEQSGERGAFAPVRGTEPTADGLSGPVYGAGKNRQAAPFYGDTGGASRFFYTAKASRSEREAWGRMTLDPQRRSDGRAKDIENPRLRTSERVNDHPTVKPLALMEWLIQLVTPPGGTVLDPFCGSGSTLVAARRLNVRAIGIEQDARSVEIARQRIDAQWEVRLV